MGVTDLGEPFFLPEKGRFRVLGSAISFKVLGPAQS